jgi:hypothetical protein
MSLPNFGWEDDDLSRLSILFNTQSREILSYRALLSCDGFSQQQLSFTAPAPTRADPNTRQAPGVVRRGKSARDSRMAEPEVERPDALFVAYRPSNYANRQLIAAFGIEHRIPGIFPYRERTMTGG